MQSVLTVHWYLVRCTNHLDQCLFAVFNVEETWLIVECHLPVLTSSESTDNVNLKATRATVLTPLTPRAG